MWFFPRIYETTFCNLQWSLKNKYQTRLPAWNPRFNSICLFLSLFYVNVIYQIGNYFSPWWQLLIWQWPWTIRPNVHEKRTCLHHWPSIIITLCIEKLNIPWICCCWCWLDLFEIERFGFSSCVYWHITKRFSFFYHLKKKENLDRTCWTCRSWSDALDDLSKQNNFK